MSAQQENGSGTESWTVVRNEEEQYSIWPADRPAPQGWTEIGVVGDRDHCLDHIGEVWTDIRPLSLRRALGVA
ncbi:MbtH family protein [Pseudonocardia sp. HH130630-07]|uniref:MbtH family protein n=1 Tax=Pseudonocardia sp. HH130630-07 TaxID=1690815 RepID=UPI000814BA67|nr:MbtH family NRPS accessory protein [Pseudonocardia sp. HH130630-07]ANY06014.1 antibiotic synthesis protein MbtH [Pseudonocardia sp. HH130630-07]